MMSPKRWNFISLVFTCLCFSKSLLIKGPIEDTIFHLLLETGPPFYVVIRTTRGSSRLQGKGGTDFHFSVLKGLEYWSGPSGGSNPRSPSLEKIGLPR